MSDKKKEVIAYLLKKDILVDPKTLEKLNNDGHLEKIHSLISSNEEIFIKDIFDEKEKHENTDKNKADIVFSYKEKSKKIDVREFVSYFNQKYKVIKSMLQNRQELQNAVSIKRVSSKQEKEETAIIGMVLEKSVTKNNNIMLSMEDPTGIINVVVNKNKPDLFETAKDIVVDEVMGIVGSCGKNIIFANNLIFPEIPLNKELKKAPTKGYAVFISDCHFGSKFFMKEEFDKFIKWLNGEVGSEDQKEISKNVKYVFIIGDLVDGVGIYPNQQKDQESQDIYEQYALFAKALSRFPKNIKIIVSPGNHDAVRTAEPQPEIYEDFAKELYKLPNVLSVSNPATVNIDHSETFPGFDVLIYHGYSFPYFSDNVESIRKKGGITKADLIMKFLLQRRHLAPSHTSTLYVPDENLDPLLIEKIPDFFVSGHIHRATISNYRNVTLLNCSCWISMTDYQEKVGLIPEPARAVVVDLQTRETKIMKF